MTGMPRAGGVAIDGTVVLFTAALSIFSGLFLCVLATLRLRTEAEQMSSLKGTGANRGEPGRQRVRNLLVVCQLALAMVLLTACGLMSRTFWNLRGVDPGLETDRVLTFQTVAPFFGISE